jgi:DNA helicase HerA-like ATPase
VHSNLAELYMKEKTKIPHKRARKSSSSCYGGIIDNDRNFYDQNSSSTELIELGKIVISEKFPSTMDEFWFSVNSEIVINPFDFVSVENIRNTTTVGVVKELRAVERDSVGQVRKRRDTSLQECEKRDNIQDLTIAKVAIMGNIEAELDKQKTNMSISMPIRAGKSVRFANFDEVIFGLGIPEMEYPIPVGVIEMSNGSKVPVSLAISYLVGPDAAHVNASGVSGNLKTSYLLFLLQSMYQKLAKNNEVSIILFNTREEDLLHIHERQDVVSDRDEELFKLLKLNLEPFHNVSYFLPRGKDGKPLSIHIPENSRTYSYELQDIYDRLELLFSETYDPHYNLSSIIDYIYESWPLKDRSGKIVENWSNLHEFRDYPQQIITHKYTLLHFLGQLQRFRKLSMFTDKQLTSTYVGREIKKIAAGDVFVIDIAMIPTLEEQSFVVADVMKNIDQLYSTRYNLVDYHDNINNSSDYGSNNNKGTTIKRPNYILIFIDEINRFLPKSNYLGIRSAVAEQIMKTIIAGKSRNTILFSAQQFKSEVDYALHENTGLHITAKIGLSELSTKAYSMIDRSTKMNITRLNKGEMVMIQAAFRQPIKISFPRPSFKRPTR